MLHLPFLIVSNIAKKAAVTTANIAGKAARVAATTAEKAARIQVRAAQRAASKAHLHAMRSLPRKPTVRLVKEVRSGRTSMSFYRKFDHASGRVSDFWTLNRDTGQGRIRVASGPMSEFKNLREVVDRSFGREAPRQQVQQITQAGRQAPRTQGAGRVAEESRRGRDDRGFFDHHRDDVGPPVDVKVRRATETCPSDRLSRSPAPGSERGCVGHRRQEAEG